MTIFKSFQENPRLKRNTKKAAEGNPDAAYQGPDGQVLVKYTGNSSMTKDGVDMAFLRFMVVDEEYSGQKLSICHYFGDTEVASMEETQAAFCRDLNLLGVETLGRDPSQWEKDLAAVQRAGTVFKVAVKANRKRPQYPYVDIVGPAEAQPSEAAEAPQEPAEDPQDDEEEEAFIPSECVDCECVYQKDTCVVTAGDDEQGTLELANPEDPEEVWYEDVPVGDVEWVE